MRDFDDYVHRSTRTGKKWMVRVNGRLIHFGSAAHEDYTTHHDKERRHRYSIRHKNDHIYDELTPGFWSYWLLWGPYTSIKKNFKHIMLYFNPSLDKL